jgi:hypothetical protein
VKREWTEDEVGRRIVRAMSRVVDDDLALLKHGPSERAVSHRLAVYIEHEFCGWNVDCEYNRQGGANERKQVDLPDKAGAEVDPDIIVHVRGPEGPNLLAIEIKPDGASAERVERDRRKLLAYLVFHNYRFTALLTYRTGDQAGFAAIEWVRRPEGL